MFRGGHSSVDRQPHLDAGVRPTQYVASVFQRRPSFRPVIRAMSPICHLLDLAARPQPSWRRYGHPRPLALAVDEQPSDADILWCIRQFASDRSLQPAYEPDSFAWLLKKAAEKRMHGALRMKRGARRAGLTVGWYLYYVDPGGVAQVLQFGARQKFVEQVLNSLFHDAWKLGAVGVSGKLEFRYAKELAKARCGFVWPGYGTVVHARNRELLNAIAHGDAFLSRLEGEWWARFSDPTPAPRLQSWRTRAHFAHAPQLKVG